MLRRIAFTIYAITYSLASRALIRVSDLSRWLRVQFWRTCPFNLVIGLLRVLPVVRPSSRRRARAALCIQKAVIGDGANKRVTRITKEYIDLAIYYRNRQLTASLQELGIALGRYVEPLRRAGRPVIYAPFHMESDAIALVLAGISSKQMTYVVSTYSKGHFGADEANTFATLGVEMDHFHPETQQTRGGKGLLQVIKEVRRRSASLVVFADAIPEYTNKITKAPMRESEVELFGRRQRIHSGLSDLARSVGGVAVFFYVAFSNGRLVLNIIGTSEHTGINYYMATQLERALRTHPSSWMLWHYTSFFGYCSGAERENELHRQSQ
jgi:hypothetical protein